MGASATARAPAAMAPLTAVPEPLAAPRRKRRGLGRAARAVGFGAALLAAGAWHQARAPGQAAAGLNGQPAPGAALRRQLAVPGRRDVLRFTSAGLALPGAVRPALAEASPTLTAGWTANEGVSFLTSFSEESYGAMRDDTRRTPAFVKAIRKRVQGNEGKLTVLDIGTGPFALFALVAARAGAKKVYAVEANPEAAARAKAIVAKATDIPPGTVEVIEGFTTSLDLPEKVDMVCAEIVGALASEENLVATIRDAQARHLKNPSDPNAYIPFSVQTFGAPVSYALHPVLAPPRYERLKGQPLRVNCRDKTVQLLSDPKVIEDIRFADVGLPGPGHWQPAAPFDFRVCPERLEANCKEYYEALLKEQLKPEEAEPVAVSTANSFSGMAFWPRLMLDPAGEIVVESRGPMGEHQKSHWQTLLALMSPTPVPVRPGQTLRITETADLQGDILAPAKYSLRGELLAA
uniref:Protein arginine N-methyltransferase n=1 Tax=Alexandrium monilatum TaxID=311494 RepID=A0A7S4SJ80_9DINO